MDLEHALKVASHFSVIDEPNVWLAAFFHDAIEDDYATASQLVESGLSYNDVVLIVQVLTRAKDETYRDYITRLAFDDTARRIKLADVTVNLERMDEAHMSLKPRYIWAMNYLENYEK